MTDEDWLKVKLAGIKIGNPPLGTLRIKDALFVFVVFVVLSLALAGLLHWCPLPITMHRSIY